MTFEEWYKARNPQLDPLEDDCLEELKSAYEAGKEAGYEVGDYMEGLEEGIKIGKLQP